MAPQIPLSKPILSRRQTLAAALVLPITALKTHGARAQPPSPAEPFAPPSHGLSIFGPLKYPPGFSHFDYVNPAAPKGGEIALGVSSTTGNQNFQTFDTLNIFSRRGNGAAGMGLIFDSLMTSAADEPDSLYGLVAESVSMRADGLACRFTLHPQAQFHNGTPIRAEDVVFTLETLKSAQAYPIYPQMLRQVESALALSTKEVEFRFTPGRSREVPLIVAGLPILSQAYYAAHPFEAGTLDQPLGSGPYRVEALEQGRSITFKRVRDYWGRDLPTTRGHHNFEIIRYEYFRDREAAFQAFTAGVYTFREEFTSLIWATRYDFPATKAGRVKRETIPDGRPSGTQGWFFNTRRKVFADPRVREALAMAFDFEWANKNLMYSLYKRTNSYFENSPLKAQGAPDTAERALLDPLRALLPDSVFAPPADMPITDGTGQDRTVLRAASQLLAQAGCKKGEDGVLHLADGTKLSFEFLETDTGLTKHVEAYIRTLRLLGVEARIRQVDPSQYQRRVQEFDFDVVSARFTMSLAPGESLNLLFSSRAAAQTGSRNLAGIRSPAIDTLIEQVIAAPTREAITPATRALDRALRAGHYWIPAWHSAEHKIAYWDRFERPGPMPPLAGSADGFATATWWAKQGAP